MWYAQANVKALDDDELLLLARKSGCVFLTIGLESITPSRIEEFKKSYNDMIKVKMIINKLHKHNIYIWGSFMFGFDEDNKEIFRRTLECTKYLKLDIATFEIRTPFPGTVLYERLKEEGRLIERDWRKYDLEHVVFQPKLMNPGELLSGQKWTMQKFYSITAIFKRMVSAIIRIVISRRYVSPRYIFLFNLAGRAIIKVSSTRQKER